MNLQQLEYIVAVDKYRHFVKAAESCGVSQPTLSMMIQKLESELDVQLFDRRKHPLETTKIGERIVRQAEAALLEYKKIQTIVAYEFESLSGHLSIGIIPTIAPYLLPGLINRFQSSYPDIRLTFSERNTAELIQDLRSERMDVIIAATPLEQPDFLEIPLYYEKFVAYFSADNPDKDIVLRADSMPRENLWVLEEGHCLRDQLFNFCTSELSINKVFEAGSIDTLVRIIDNNGGYTLIPELHMPYLTDIQRTQVRELSSSPAVREVSVIIKKTFIKEKMLNALADTIKELIPPSMLDERLKKFAIRL